MASRRARGVGQQVRQCALRARSDCDEGRACCNVQNAPFLPRVARVSPTRRARDVRVAVRAGCGGGALRIAPCRRSSALTAVGAWEVRIVVELGVLRMYAISRSQNHNFSACLAPRSSLLGESVALYKRYDDVRKAEG